MISLHRFFSYIFTLSYIVMMLVAYPHIAQLYYYMGYVYSDQISLFPCFALCVLSLFPVLLFPRLMMKPSTVVIAAIYYVVYIPSILIPYMMGRLPFGIVLTYDLILLMSLSVLFATTFRKSNTVYRIPMVQHKKMILITLFAFISFMLFYIAYQMLPLFKLVGFKEMYRQRALAGALLKGSEAPGMGYFYNWITAVILPILILLGLIEKKYYLLGFGLLIAFIMYGITASKTAIALPLVIMGAYVLIQRTHKIAFIFMASCFCGFILLGFVWPFWMNTIIRRVIITPGMLTSWYILFSLEHPLTYFSDSVLRAFISYPYVNTIPAVVSEYNIGRAFAANANYLAYSTVQLGYIAGPLVSSCILGLFLRAYDAIALALMEIDSRYYSLTVLILVPFINALVNTAIFTALFTGGGVLVMLFLYGTLSLKTLSPK